MQNKATLRKLSLGVLGAIATLAITIGVADAFTGPGSSGGVGNGAVATDGANNVTIGNSTVLATTKLSVYASSTSASSYGLQVLQPGGASIFYVRNDGAVNVSGTLSVTGTFTSPVVANNVSSGTFGANTGGGNYVFPSTLTTTKLRVGIATSTNVFDVYDAWGSHLYFGGNTDNTLYVENKFQPGSEASVYVTNYNETQSVSIGTNTGNYGGYIDGTPNLVLTSGGGFHTWGGDAFTVHANYIPSGGGFSLALRVMNGTLDLFDINVGGQALITTGTAALPSYAYINDVNTGTFTPASDIWAVATNGAERMRIGSTGNIGIATTTAGYPLTVAGTIYSSSGGFRFPDGTTQTTASGGSTISAPNVSAGNFGANTGNGNYNFPANLGIGMPSPSYGFDINSTSSPLRVRDTAGRTYLQTATRTGTYGTCPTVDIAGRITVDCSGPEGGNDTYIRHPVNSIQFFQSENVTYPGNFIVSQKGGTYGLWVQQDTNGNVGINTYTPSQKLEVAGTIYSSSGGFKFPDGTTQTTAAGSATIPATNVSAGSFGANTGGGNYSFPGTVTITSAGSGNLLAINASGANQSRIALATGSGISGINFTSNGNTFFIDNRGSADASLPANRLSFFTNSGNEMVSFLQTGQAVFNPQGIGTNPGFSTKDRLIMNNYGNGTTTIAWGDGGGGNIYARIYYTNDPTNIFYIESNQASYIPFAMRTRSSDGVVSNQISINSSLYTYFNAGTNVGVGTTTPGYPLTVAGTIFSSSGGFRFPDGTTQTTAAGGATIPAANVSAGTFAANTGGGNFTFSGLLGIGAAPTTDKLEITTTGTNRSRIRMISGTGVAGVEFVSNGASWFLDNRGGNETPYNRLGFYSPTGGEAFTILSAGNVGIGNTNPGSKLSVAGTIGATGTITSSDSSTNIGSHPSYGTGYSAFWRTGTDYAVMTNGSDTFINAPAGGGSIYFRMNNGYAPSAMDLNGTTLTIGGGSGKLNVGTVDPIYQIGGEKFATYLPGMIGVKEEVAGELILSCTKGACEKTIDFSKEARGSDLWLFAKATDIKKHLAGASIMLTPAFDGRVSYRKGDGTLTIMASTFDPKDEVSVSYRFTASRFDADKWSNRTNDKGEGFIINE